MWRSPGITEDQGFDADAESGWRAEADRAASAGSRAGEPATHKPFHFKLSTPSQVSLQC